MKKIILSIGIILSALSCSDNEQSQSINTENATIYYDPSGIDNCVYTLKMDNEKYYSTEHLDNEFRENNLRVKISYRKTEKELNCGFSGNLTIIEIETIKKLE